MSQEPLPGADAAAMAPAAASGAGAANASPVGSALEPEPPAMGEAEASAEAGDDPLPRWLVYTGVVAAFLIVGPPLGTLVVGFPVAIAWTWGEGGISWLLLLLMMMLFSYPFGALPALLTGVAAARAWPRLRGWRAHLYIGLIGGGLSALCTGAVITLLDSGMGPAYQGGIVVALCALAGCVGATLLSRLLQALRQS
ncbi:hypothetical protein GGR77_003113 [Xanthomonas translucens]